jgi:hypothetical protein
VAQGKSDADLGSIPGMAEKTVKRHLTNISDKPGLESRHAATVREAHCSAVLFTPSSQAVLAKMPGTSPGPGKTCKHSCLRVCSPP